MRFSRRTIIGGLLAAAALKAVAGMTLVTLASPASAQGNGNGGGNGNGNGNGNGGGNGGGNGNGNGGNGNGGNGGNGSGNAGSNGNGKGGKSAGASASAHAMSRSDAAPASPASRVSVIHSNGMSESISGGRYEMHDAKGRLIVRRQATTGDVSRLKAAH